MALSRTQVDRLGERLRRGNVSDDDLRELDAYRRSFAAPYATVVAVLRDELGLAPTGRPAKSTKSLTDKLNRETARLSQIQDVAGCRVITADVLEQERVAWAIRDRFGEVTVVDRRERPSHGYRAVHLLVAVGDRRVEIQVRTALQHLWAELSERLSDRLGIVVKYGGGDGPTRDMLDELSGSVAEFEAFEKELADPDLAPDALVAYPELVERVARLRTNRQLLFDGLRTTLQRSIARFTAPHA